MSLSSFLLRSTEHVDTELDALFKLQPSTPESHPKKRKLENAKDHLQSKRAKADVTLKKVAKDSKKSKSGSKPSESYSSKPKKSKRLSKGEDSDAEDTTDLEANYPPGREDDRDPSPTQEEPNDEPEDAGDETPSNLLHESLSVRRKDKSAHGSKKKYVPPDETSEQRDQRTIFIGNLPLEIAQKRPLQKQLQRHILSFIPTAKTESMRFRSIPFSAPATKLTEDTTEPKSKSHPQHKKPSQREHDRERTSSWRQTQDPDEETVKNDEKKYLNPNQKKKVAFINQEFHSTADTIHAYLVFAHPALEGNRPSNLPPLPPCMNPYEAAREAVRKADGTLFLERVLRVDLVGKKIVGAESVGAEGQEFVPNDADPKLTLFVGNLDLASKDEDLRAFFETLMKTERGDPPGPAVEGDSSDKKKPSTWVTRVRIVRDRDTQLGKGFGYVQFMDRECVDEILAMDPSQLKFAKRKLRVQRCKTLPGAKFPSSAQPNPHSVVAQKKSKTNEAERPQIHLRTSSSQSPLVTVPRGDPSLGKKLANLPKDQRKKIKASDADRVARRLAKKKARMAMNTSKDRQKESGVERKRERVRRDSGGLPRKGKDVKRKKGRVRSEKSLEKRNMKK